MVILPSDTRAALRLWWLPLLQHPRLQKAHRVSDVLSTSGKEDSKEADFLGFDKDIISHAQQHQSAP